LIKPERRSPIPTVCPTNQISDTPAARKKLKLFAGMLKKSSKKLTAEQESKIIDYFTKNAPKPDAN